MLRMLLVEDSERFRRTVKMVLSTYFPSVVIDEATDGEEAMKKIDLFFPDLVFSDIRLPGENGIKLTGRIKSAHPEIPVIILTNCDLPEYEKAAYEAGANYFIAKSVSTGEQLARLIESVISARGNNECEVEPGLNRVLRESSPETLAGRESMENPAAL